MIFRVLGSTNQSKMFFFLDMDDFVPVAFHSFSTCLTVFFGRIQLQPKVWTVLNSKSFLLPQRRHRVWGIAFVLNGKVTVSSVSQEYAACLQEMHSNFQFPMQMNFPPKPKEALRNSRHKSHVEQALAKSFGDEDLFVDCAGSLSRPVIAQGAIPCITPSHPVYSTKMKRYLTNQDFLNGQGLWRSCFSEDGYTTLLNDNAFSQDLAGNSFSSTVYVKPCFSGPPCS